MRERGKSFGQIQRRLLTRGIKLSTSAISWHCLRLGADLPPEKRQRMPTRTTPVRRGGYLVRPFTPAEDERLLDLSAEGKRICEIARAFGGTRQHNSIIGRLMTLARREARAEDAMG